MLMQHLDLSCWISGASAELALCNTVLEGSRGTHRVRAMLCCYLFMYSSSKKVSGPLEPVRTLDMDSSQPQKKITWQTASCACRKGQIAGTTGGLPACVDKAWKAKPSIACAASVKASQKLRVLSMF